MKNTSYADADHHSKRLRELETAFPWVRDLPPLAQQQLVSTIDSYHQAAVIYARNRQKTGAGAA
jgi:hypothetical protein